VFTGVLISPYPDQEGNKLQRPNSNFGKPLKNNSEGCPSSQVSAAAVTSASDEKWRPFNCFFSRVGLRTYQHLCSCRIVFFEYYFTVIIFFVLISDYVYFETSSTSPYQIRRIEELNKVRYASS